MDVVQAIKSRKSVRSFLDKPVESEKLVNVLEAARLAPSIFNRQEWRFVIVRDVENKRKLVNYAKSPSFISEAPVVIVACAKPNETVMSCNQPCYIIDVTIALDHVTLAAIEYGLGSCWSCLFDENKVKEIFGIPEEIRVIALMPLGYPTDPSLSEKRRLPLAQLIKFETW